jgi:drug/metabolite transporter (DMT)-like permease
VGAGRTGTLIGTVPIFSAVLGALFFSEYLSAAEIGGILCVVGGVYLVSSRPSSGHSAKRAGAGHATHALLGSAFGLGTALCFSVSPVFLRFGLSHYGSPTLAVSIGLAAATLAYALLLAAGRVLGRSSGARRRAGAEEAARITLVYQLLAGVFIALGTWLRYLAVDMIPLALVTTLARISIPLVLVLSPVFLGGRLERVTPRVWIGAALILGGVTVVTLR